MGSSRGGCDWLTDVGSQGFQNGRRRLLCPHSRLVSMFSRSHCFSCRPFHVFFWSAMFKRSGLSTFSWAPLRLRDVPCVEPPVLVWLHLFHKSTMLLPMFSWWPAGTLLLAALSRALSSSAAEHHVFAQATILAEAWDFFAHGRGWIRPFVFFRLFLWLSRSFWILSLPAGYLQALVAFHYINNFTVYYWVAVRPDPHSVLYPAYHPVYTSSGSWTFFFFFCFNKCKWTAKCQLWLSLLWYKGTLSWQSFFPVL